MANSLFYTIRSSGVILRNIKKIDNCYGFAAIFEQNIRSLYSKSTLGIEGFLQSKERINNQMQNIVDKFKEKMIDYSKDESANMIFTEDLKNMAHLAETDEDLELVVRMIKRYNQQNKSLRFGNFIFGPVIMRMFYVQNKPDLAFECFKSPEVSGFFDQLMSYQILLDLLYENKKYKEMLEAVDLIKDKQIEGTKFPRNVIVLALAACYKMNSKESLEYALKLWQELQEIGHFPMRRATTFCAGLALNQGKPELAMEILTSARNQNYTTVRNLKVAALADLGRVEDAIPVLRSVLNEDLPEGTIHTFNRDVLERVKSAIAKRENPEITLEFNRLEQLFQKQGHISDTTLDQQLCTEIQKPPQMNNRDRDGQPQQRYPRRYSGNSNQPFQNRRRPGLVDLV